MTLENWIAIISIAVTLITAGGITYHIVKKKKNNSVNKNSGQVFQGKAVNYNGVTIGNDNEISGDITVKNGAQIVVCKDEPADLKEGDIWCKVLDDKDK